MANQAIAYGTRTAFGSASNLNSLTNGQAKPMGAVTTTGNVVGYLIDISITPASSSTSATGYMQIYLIEANDGGTNYTDRINPAGTSDVTSTIKNARPIRQVVVNANSGTIGVFQDNFMLPVMYPANNWSLIVSNQSGANLPSSTHSIYYTPVYYTIA